MFLANATLSAIISWGCWGVNFSKSNKGQDRAAIISLQLNKGSSKSSTLNADSTLDHKKQSYLVVL